MKLDIYDTTYVETSRLGTCHQYGYSIEKIHIKYAGFLYQIFDKNINNQLSLSLSCS